MPDPMEEITMYPLDTPGIIGGLTEEEVKKIRRNILRLYKWGTENQIILQQVNKRAEEQLKKTDEDIKKEVLNEN